MIEIADFVSGEKAELHAMRRQAVHSRCANDYTLEQRQGWVPDGLCEDTWRARFQEYRPFVARLPGSEFRRMAGLADVRADGYIDKFYVAHWCAGLGLARALRDEIHQRALEMGPAQLFSDAGLTAQPFFALHGFNIEEMKRWCAEA